MVPCGDIKTMKLLIILLVSITCTTADRRCSGITFNSKYYDIEILKEGINKIHQMVLNRNDNTVYFTYDQMFEYPSRSLGYLNLNTREGGLIGGVRNASGVAVDQARNRIYVGGADGLYVLNKERVPEKYPVYDTIDKLFFRNILFYINGRKEAYVFDNGLINRMTELEDEKVDDLIVDDDNNVFFLKNTTLLRTKLGMRAVNAHDRYVVKALTVDSYFRAFVTTNDGVYIYNTYKFALDKVASISNLRALTFNKNMEPIYAIEDVLVKLNVNPVRCIEY